MNTGDLMTRDVVTCRAEDSAGYAARLMWEHDCGVIPVVDAEQKPIAMVTDRDLCMAAFTTGRALFDIRVDTAMSKGVRACKTTDSIGAAESAMRQLRVRRIPIVDGDGRIVGMLSMSDLARAASERQRKHGETQSALRAVETLAAVCQPWCNVVDRPATAPPTLIGSRTSLVSPPTHST